MEFNDTYAHITPGVTYIPENLPTEDIIRRNEYELMGCDCINLCTSSESCACIQRSGAVYSFSDSKNLNEYILGETGSNRPVYECNKNCRCQFALCGQKLVQFGPRPHLKIFDTDKSGKGYGLLTETSIKLGSFICEYAGEVLTQKEVLIRYKFYREMDLQNNYIFCINENFGESSNEKTFIDPTFYGNIGRYINHSCAPNCTLIPVRIDDNIPKLCIFANQNINKQTELTFDYGQNDRPINNIKERKKCLCGAQNCRMFLPFDDTLTDDL